ncbi:MAG: MATE family efflux transporter [Coriobacteriales bacterium]|nr:MATE family efflux transporter [Coriobacteriales bacterium]
MSKQEENKEIFDDATGIDEQAVEMRDIADELEGEGADLFAATVEKNKAQKKEPSPEEIEFQKRKAKEEEKSKKQVLQFEKAKLSPLLLKYSIPAIIGMLAGGIQNIVNRIFVGQAVNSYALAGVQIGFPVMALFMAFSFLIGMGSMLLISVRLGQKRKKDAEEILGQCILLSVLVPTFFNVIFHIWIDDILVFIGSTETILPYARDYFSIFMVAMIPFSVSASVNNVIRAQGAPNVAMGTQILASVLNIIFNYFFVMIFGWGVKGAALGVFLGNFISLFWIFGYFMSKHSYLKVHAKNIRIFPKALKPVIVMGITPFLIQLANSLQNFIMNINLGTYGGDTALSALSIVMSLSTILLMPLLGFSQGAQPIIGYNYGAGNYNRMKGTLFRGMIFATIVSIASWLAIWFWAEGFVAVFINNEPEVEALAAHALRIFFAALPIIGAQIVALSIFQACGKAVRSAFLSLSRQLLFFIPCLLILPNYFGLEGCWISAPISDCLTFVVTTIFLIFGLRSIKREMEEKGVGNLVK